MNSSRENSMTKRSDFAQKLLDDLRLRKERLAASQNSGHANCLAADKYSYSNRSFKGSREIKAKSTSFRDLNTQNRYSGGSKSLKGVEASNQIVPFERGQSSGKIDLSKALAFALENAGKATKVDPSGGASIINFLHQIGRRSMDYGRTERRGSLRVHQPSNSQLPMIHVHIKEISKGAQKLNQIIKACSNGLGFGNGRYSIEYGKELMQGAIELEQSLRMLVDIQETSEYMTNSQRKSRIKLLDEDDEDEDDATLQLELPRFPFDMPFRNYHNINEIARADIKIRLPTLTYSEDNNINHRKAPTVSRASSHRRSVSYNPNEDGLSRFTEEIKQSRSSKLGNRRIPNVVAKLMGLGEFPDDEDTRYKEHEESTLKTKIETNLSIKSEVAGGKKFDQRSKDADIAFRNTRQRVMQANKFAAPENLALQAERNLTSKNIALNLVIHGETRSSNVMKEKTKNQKNIWEKEREKDDVDDRKSNNAAKGEAKEVPFKNESKRMTANVNRRPRPTVEFQGEKEYKPNAPLTENNHRSGKPILRSQQKPPNNLGFEQLPVLDKSDYREAKNQGEEIKKDSEKEKLLPGRPKANVLMTNHLLKPLSSVDVKKKLSLTNKATVPRKNSPEFDDALCARRSPFGNHKSKPSDESFGFSLVHRKDLNPKSTKDVSSPPNRETELKNGDNSPATEEKLVLVQAAQKAKEGKVHKSEISQRINQPMAKQNGSWGKLTRPLKNQNSISKEEIDGKQELHNSYRDSKLTRINTAKEAEACSTKSKTSVSNMESSEASVAQDQRAIKDDPPMLIPREDGSQILKQVPSQAHANIRQEIIMTPGNDQQAPKSISKSNEAHRSSQAVPRTLKGTKGDMEASSPNLEQPQKLPKREIQETLTEGDIHLKKILVKSQLFLDTAEALFKLNLPLGILLANGNDYNQEDSNLILDCGYEIMKRKGRRRELSVHPFVKACLSSSKVTSLDDLVKQLSKEFEKLRSYGRDGCIEPVGGDYLPKMLERDVHYNNPDLNSMWDMGWSDSMLAFIEKDDVIRDMERYVLNGLVEEITRDLICI